MCHDLGLTIKHCGNHCYGKTGDCLGESEALRGLPAEIVGDYSCVETRADASQDTDATANEECCIMRLGVLYNQQEVEVDAQAYETLLQISYYLRRSSKGEMGAV